MCKRAKGFTLIELMIAVAIIAVLAGIGYPSYLEQVRKTGRSDAKVALNDVAQRLQRCQTATGTYNPVAPATCDVVTKVLASAGITSKEGLYVVKATAANLTASAYLITATPVTGKRQANDADCTSFTLDQTGTRKAFKGGTDNTTACW